MNESSDSLSAGAARPISTRKLTLSDIADLRAYERERDQARSDVIAMKHLRRLALGTMITVMFENRETMRYQIQEMARVEKLISDEEIQTELDIYNSLIPEPGMLCATVFIELTSDEAMREWLPKLVGIESSLVFRLADGTQVRSRPEAQHAQQLTRAEMTSAVHYVEFEFTPAQIAVFALGPTTLALDHTNYAEEIELLSSSRAELCRDLVSDSK